MVEYEYAFDKNNNLIEVDKASVGVSYICPECGEELRPKNKGRIKAHHFFHYNGVVDHSGSIGESPNVLNRFILAISFLITMFK